MNARETGQASVLTGERKGEIYEVLRGELRRRRSQRRAVRAASAGAAVCVVAAGAVMMVRWGTPTSGGMHGGTGIAASGSGDGGTGSTPAPELVPAPAPERSDHAARPVVAFAPVETDAGIAERLSLRPTGRVTVRRIGDDELLAALDEAGGGERFGLVRAGAKVAVVCQTCDAGSGPEWMEGFRREWPRRNDG